VCAYGWQATTTTLVSLRSTVHALRGWPTPLGVAINSADTVFNDMGLVSDDRCADQLTTLSNQVLDFIGARP
jgi:FMN reductase